MGITLNDVVSGRQPKPPRIIVYGGDGVGKSTLVKDGFILDFEGGNGYIDVFKSVDLVKRDWNAVTETLKLIHDNPKEIGTNIIVLDSIDWLERIIFADVADEKNVSSVDEIGYFKGFSFAIERWKKLLARLDKLRALDFTVVMIAHSQIVKVEDPMHDSYDMHHLKLHKSARAILMEWADIVSYVSFEVLTHKVSGTFGNVKNKASSTGQRLMHLSSDQPQFQAKSRLDLPDQLPLDWKVFSDAIASAMGTKPKTKTKGE